MRASTHRSWVDSCEAGSVFSLKDHALTGSAKLGSASVVTNSTGTIVGEDRFYLSPRRHLRYASTFGETRFTTGTMFTDKLFTGQREMPALTGEREIALS